ncbi:MAG: PfaB family protein, partial [Chloroflexota bacterium]
LGREGGYAHLILSEEVNQSAPDRDTDYNLSQAPFYLFPLAAESRAGLLEELETLKQQLQNEVDLPSVARQAFVAFQAQTQATYALAIVGSDRGEVLGEIQAALKGVVIAFDKAGEWKTPLGSYFTAKPLGNIANGSSSVAFVYPGAFNSFVGLGQDLFHLFPRIYDKFVNITPELGMALGEKLLYPRSLEKLSKEQLETLEAQLGLDQVTMIESGASFAVLFTMIMRHYFQVQPRASFGYSMGETSMLWAMEVWTGGGLGLATFHESPLFRTRLTGPKETVRELWGLEQANDDFWTNYFLLAPVAKVREALKNEERVYLTHINTAQEVIIGGAKEGCLRVIEKLKCHYLHRPVSFVLHCEPVRAEYEELVKLHTFPCRDMPEVAFYTAADYQPLPFDSTSLGQKIAQMICQPLDFPRLVNQVYDDGAKIFVELGPGNTCSRWIGKILRHKDHATLSISQKGVDDHISIVKVLARLLSHRVPLNLAPLYGHVQERSNIDLATPPLYPDEQFQKLSENSELATKAHATFLQVRQEASRQMSELLRLQTQLVESLLELSNTDEHREPQRTTDNFIDNTHT